MRRGAAAFLAVVLGLSSAFAQTSPPAAPPADPVFVAAKSSFEALDIEARRAIQRDLVWAGGFTGGATGEFGPLTFAAIRRFETNAKTSVNGVLDAAERAALAKAAGDARTATGFRIETDKATGMRIGVPAKLFTKKSANSTGSDRWQSADDKATLDLLTYKPEETLETLFVKGTDPKVAGRKITYKLIRPEFFVITGETASGKFYRRVEKGANGALRAFSVGYDKALAAQVDPLVIAMASTFEAFPGATPAASQVATPSTPSAPPVAVKPPRVTGIVVAEGKIVTSEAAIRACKTLALDGQTRMPAAVAKSDATLGLALITTATARVKPVPPASVAITSGLMLQRDLDGKLLAAPADVAGGFALTPLQEGGAGAAIFDAHGALGALIISEPVAKFAVAGTMPLLRHKLVSAGEMAKFADVPVVEAGRTARSSGEIAAEAGAGVVSLICSK